MTDLANVNWLWYTYNVLALAILLNYQNYQLPGIGKIKNARNDTKNSLIQQFYQQFDFFIQMKAILEF